MKVFQVAICFLLVGATAITEDSVSWTNKDGKEIVAEFRGIENGEIQLLRSDGLLFSFPITDLSLESQRTLQEMLKEEEVSHLPPLYRNRIGTERRRKALELHGGDEAYLEAVSRGLEWLASCQNADGSLGTKYTVASTGLALLAFLGNGETHETTRHHEVVTKAISFLMDRSVKAGGFLSNGEDGSHECYEHAIATQALVEALAMIEGAGQKFPHLESATRKAIGRIVEGTMRDGGWAYGYRIKTDGDLSLSNWQIQALWLARESGFSYSGVESSLDSGVSFVLSMQDERGAFRYRADHERGKPTLTGGALFSLQNGRKQDDPVYFRGIEYLFESYSNASPGPSYYAYYFNMLTFFHDENRSRWAHYRDTFLPRLRQEQKPDGSWPDESSITKTEGGVINTAWAILMLETFYRYDWDSLSP